MLVVDDEPDILTTVKAYLERSLPDVQVLTAPSGPEALTLLEQEPVDLVMADYRMPGMDGLELLTRIRTRHPGVLRFMFTAYPDVELAMRAANEGKVLRFFTKPLEPAQVRDTIIEVLRDRRREMLRQDSFQRAMRLLERVEKK